MNKKIIAGVVALSMVASMAAFTANAQKLGDVDDDKDINIVDAVSIINYINGNKPLEGMAEMAADVTQDGIVDIEDAVAIINHINGVKPIDDIEIVTPDEDSQEDSKPDSSETESKPDSSSEAESTPDSSETESKPDSSEADDSSQAEEKKNTEELMKKASDGEFKVQGAGKVNYEGKSANVNGYVEQKDGVTHFAVYLNGTLFEEAYTVGDTTYVADSAGDFDPEDPGKSRFGNLAKGKIADLIAAHSSGMGDVEIDGNTESFDFKFYDSIFAKKELEVVVTITYDDNGNPTSVKAVNKADENDVVFESTTVSFTDTTDDIELPEELKAE